MADLNTKQKILQAAIQLFNQHGLANVRLKQIAEKAGISVGNLAYHYQNKEAIVDKVMEDLHNELDEILASYRLFPNLIDFDIQLSKYYEFLQKYPFYFLDLLEIGRTYTGLSQKRQQHAIKMMIQIRKRFDFKIKRGVIIEEPREGFYDTIANSIWTSITFYIPQGLLLKNDRINRVSSFKEMVWNQLYPYFTPKGVEEFEQLIIPLLDTHS